jgi:30S ribosomal protein S31
LFSAFFFTFAPVTNYNIKLITMGRGDIKTKKGKIFSGSFGKARPAKPAKAAAAKAAAAAKKA